MKTKTELIAAHEDGSGKLTLTFRNANGKSTKNTYTVRDRGYATAMKRARRYNGGN